MSPTSRPSSFTVNYHHLSDFICTNAWIAEAFDPTKGEKPPITKKREYEALWDTGATGSVITQKIVNECSLKPIDMVQVNTAGGMCNCLVFLVSIWLPNNFVYTNARVTLANIQGTDILIGMDIIKFGDFAITNKDGITVFSFRFPSVEHIDFTGKLNTGEINFKNIGRNNPCPCGSGKKYKHCHGKD